MAADPTAAAAAAAAAISAAMDWHSSPDARAAAFAYLESVKSGDVRALASTSFLLVRKDQTSEIRLHGFKMLQHLVRLRWDELSATERNEFANLTISLISDVVGPNEVWALKSQTAALVAEVVRREGVALLNTLLPSIVSLSNSGPIEAELVAMILRWLPEDITVHNEDLEGDRRRSLLRGLTESLPQILPLLYSLLEKHFVAALSEHNNQQIELAKQHVGTVTAVLNAVNAYAEWAPVTDLAKYGLIHGCGSLLSYRDFRLHACEFFKVICQRKRPVDVAVAEYDAAMSNIFQVLMNISQQVLTRSGTQPSAIDESEYEFAACICETMVALGSSNMQCILTDGSRTFQFLKQMLEYYQHYKIMLHFQSLLFWLAVLREPSKAKSIARVSGDNSTAGISASTGDSSVEKEKKGVSVFITDEVYSALLDVSLKKMLKNSAHTTLGLVEVWSEELEGKSDFCNYRTKLVRDNWYLKPSHGTAFMILCRVVAASSVSIPTPMGAANGCSQGVFVCDGVLALLQELRLDLIKVIASQRPVIAAASIVQRINVVFGDTNQATKSPQNLDALEGAQLGLEAVVSAIFDGSVDYGKTDQATQLQIHSIFGGILQQLLSLKWAEPNLAVIHGHYLDALGPFLRHYPDAVARVVSKLFELLTSLPITFQDSSNDSRLARLQICSSFIRISRAADKALLPHMKLLRSIHALWGEQFAQSQTGEIKAAKSMTVAEQASLLGETVKLSWQMSGQRPKVHHNVSEDSCNINIGSSSTHQLRATLGEPFFRSIECSSVTVALMENVQPLFVHCQQALNYSWSSLLHEGRAKVPDSIGNLSGSELKVEVMEEKLLRDLTREVCSVLWALASPALNSGLPSLEQLGASNRMDSSLRDLESFASSSLTGFLLLHGGSALPALRISVEVFTWTDSEAVTKVIPFCGALIHLAVATSQAELRQFVAKDLFSSIIQGLSVESNSIMSAELVGLCREIYVYLSDKDPAPRQVLLSLPHIKQEDLLAFDDSLSKTASPKEQKQHMRSLLLLATGNKLRALAAQKTTNVITNVTSEQLTQTSDADKSCR
ncbi:hypothetical protein PR202_gb20361 [Eleusine coracana subsp. coracana]|uniref:Uncharacterized protein n=1 Tax=Eleusine coracana subsp. coracana TaxID=191504 RepID=A0AAV5FCD7_ELECO|nr:hypothetical protein PR202_gb20361 [Eleusine coracana subsp. coracana]